VKVVSLTEHPVIVRYVGAPQGSQLTPTPPSLNVTLLNIKGHGTVFYILLGAMSPAYFLELLTSLGERPSRLDVMYHQL